MMKTILTLTMNPAIDLSASVNSVFANHKLRCGSVRNDPGGGGVNVSRAIKRLGGESTAMYCSGGPTGEMLHTLLSSAGIQQHLIPVREWTRQNVTILGISTNEQYRFVMPGPKLSEHEWKSVLIAVRTMQPTPDFVVASGSLPPRVPDDFYAQLAGIVREMESRLILDTSGSPLAHAVREGVFMVKPSLRELKSLALGRIEHEEDQANAAMGIINAGRCEAVAVSLGAGGVLFATKGGCERLYAPSVSVCSRVGAGDSMIAGMTLAIARGQTMREAIRYGIAAGTAAVMNPGSELCHQEDVERLLEQINKH